jgi:PKD repeat protein
MGTSQLEVKTMKRYAVVLVLLAGTLVVACGCALNPPLDARFSALPDPDGDPLTVLFNASRSTYYERPLMPTESYVFEWHFGDGLRRRTYGNALTTYTYHEAGTYTVELLLIGWDAEMARTSRRITVPMPQPTI